MLTHNVSLKNQINKIYFVGEATSNHTGTVHGALESGWQAADSLNEQLNGGDSTNIIAKIIELIKEFFAKILDFLKRIFHL